MPNSTSENRMYPRQTRNTVEMEPHERRSGPSMNLNANAGEALAIAAIRMGYQARAVTPGHRATQSPEPFPSGPDVVKASQLTPTSPSPAPARQERCVSTRHRGRTGPDVGIHRDARVAKGGERTKRGRTTTDEMARSSNESRMNQEQRRMTAKENTCGGTGSGAQKQGQQIAASARPRATRGNSEGEEKSKLRSHKGVEHRPRRTPRH